MIYFQRVAELLRERYEKPYNEIMKRREMRVRTMETKKGFLYDYIQVQLRVRPATIKR